MTSQRPQIVVGIGASAGGLEALEILLRGLRADSRLALVVMTHLSPGHPSSLTEILGRVSPLPVRSVVDDMHLEGGQVYVCPPNSIMTVVDSKLRLQEMPPRHRKPIDVFLSSVAQEFGDAAIGILLSGGGSDGTLGIKAMKEAGGLTIAQGTDGSAPAQRGMPDTAIAAGVIDLVLPIEDIAEQLTDFAGRFAASRDSEAAAATAEPAHQPIYRILHNQVGHDFSGYKESTFVRRVRRRMHVLRIEQINDYVERLRDDADEVLMLFRDLLIGVTNFFRDPEAFATLEKLVIPRLFERKAAAETVRVWVPGCATGEEVYSLAILIREHLDGLGDAPRVQIFATDIDETALAVARIGRYPAAMFANVTEHRRRRFFTGDDVSMTVNKDVRDLCIFSSHSVLRDPPFSRIDLISCRNLLIYLGSDFQSLVIPVFHFALAPRGYLFLGTSENVSKHGDLFLAVDRRQRIFQRREDVTGPLRFPQFLTAGRGAREAGAPALTPTPINLRREVDSHVIERYAPAHVVVNAHDEIVHYSPRTGRYLEPAAGLPTRHLISMARQDIRLDLRAALHEAQQTRRPAKRSGIRVTIEDRVQLIDITVDPLRQSPDPLFLVVFSELADPTPGGGTAGGGGNGSAPESVEAELRDTRDRLQATIEEYETAVEELRSSNEELQSINEELQLTNEELETSKEELQSVNEELQTVNAELNATVDEVDRAHADLRNVFDATRIATIFLDHNLVIRSFTPAAADIFNLISADRGRPLKDIVTRLTDVGDLQRDLRSVLEQGQPIERRVHRDDDAYFLMRILPYRSRPEGGVDGVLLTFVNVTTMVAAEAHQRTLVEELNHRVRNMLTVVGAIANQTLARSPEPERFVDAFLGRIQSMAGAYGLVARRDWGAVGLDEILRLDLQDYMDEREGRVHLEGPPLQFRAGAAVALNLVVHELTTNAAKHGALAVADGVVKVRWSMRPDGAGRVLALEWRERDGPAVRMPEQRGFGSDLIERQLRAALHGSVAFDFASDGLIVRIEIPENPAVFHPAATGA